MTASLALSSAAQGAAPADPAAGKRAYVKCMACHSVTPGARPGIGPNLSGVVGRKAATQPGFRYSAALQKAQLTWNEATLDKWLAKPSAVAPGTSMVFAGVANPAERAALIAYLKKPVP